MKCEKALAVRLAPSDKVALAPDMTLGTVKGFLEKTGCTSFQGKKERNSTIYWLPPASAGNADPSAQLMEAWMKSEPDGVGFLFVPCFEAF